ncbi:MULTISPECIES: single-stranded DNA-binding protein [Spirulina sp. CCY15215]|uniref:single-stranded DNA-binding protein n=1 Tax=Spirulina sp. CCY15215 TaxID=2767591 RepID=UPI00194EC244|nr:single-stranded DNA-binding protein [Spirulina major]
MGLNVVHLVGRAGRDTEIKYLDSAKQVANVSIAVNRIGRNAPPDWFNLEMWGKTAEIAANYVKKGSLIGIEGSLKLETWEDRNNSDITRSKPVIIVNRLHLLGSKRDIDPNAVSDYDD